MLWREEKRANNKEGEKFEEMLKLLELTPKNWELAEAYMDMSAPEKPELLKEVEHQDFYRLELGTLKSVYNAQGMFRRTRPELAVRFTRFVVEAGGLTARRLLAWVEPRFSISERHSVPCAECGIVRRLGGVEYVCPEREYHGTSD